MRPVAWTALTLALAFFLAGACGGSDAGLFAMGGSTTTTSTSSSSGTQCKAGGQACAAFSECCSGTCDHAACTACGAAGQSCASGCCSGLTCQAGMCEPPCTAMGGTCALSTDCCSKVCSKGKCGTCGQDGASCVLSGDCCSQVCSQGVCAASCQPAGAACSAASLCCAGLSCQAGTCQTPSTCATGTSTCSAWYNSSTISYTQLSCAAQAYADPLIACLCGACATSCTSQAICTQDWQTNTLVTQGCTTCTNSSSETTCLSQAKGCLGN